MNELQAEGRRFRRRTVVIPVVGALVLIGLIIALRYFLFSAYHVSTDDAQINGNITTVSARVKGQITHVYVAENQSVRKGAILLKIDDRDFKAALEQARAAYLQAVGNQQAASISIPQQAAVTSAQTAQAEAGISQAASGLSTAQEKVAAAQQQAAAAAAQLDAANANYVKAQQDLSRAQTLYTEGAISRAQLDAAVANETAARAARDAAADNVRQASAGVAQARSGISAAHAQLQAGSAQLAQAQTGTQTTEIKSAQAQAATAQTKAAAAALETANLQYSYTTVIAPIDGVVTKKSVNVGDMVSASQPLIAIADQRQLWVTANLKETQLEKVRVGQRATIQVDAYPHEKFSGKVESISPATGATFALIPPENASGNFTKVVQRVPVRIAIDETSDPGHVLRQGLSVEVTINTD